MASVARKDAKRFSSLNLGSTYKGAKPESKGAGNKGGFQSLGKIQGKRMPGPAQLPSLRKENAGNDPTVNLVPQTGGGWGAGKEDELENKESSNASSSSQPATQPQEDVQSITQQPPAVRETSAKKEGIWATPETNSVGPANVPPNQQFKKNFPSLEEREASNTKRITNNEIQLDNTAVPFNEIDNMSNVPPVPPGHYHYPPRPRPPYHVAPSHMGPPYLQRAVPPFRHGMPPEYNHYGHHGGSYRGYLPQQQPAPPPNSAAGGQYQYPVPRYSLHPNSSLPPNMDPYQDGQSKLVKSEELKNLELPDEDDDVGGWAGYHEEVDYSKKVVFEDSSEDEERETHQEHQQQRQSKRKEVHERESTNKENRMKEAPPLATTEQPHLHAEQSSKHATTPPDIQYFQQQHQQSSSHYSLYYNHPTRNYPVTVAPRSVDKERSHPPLQPDLQPIWQQTRRGPKTMPPPETAWGEDKLVSPPVVSQSSTVQNIPNEQMDSIQQQLEQTTLNDSDSNVTNVPADKKHVTFHLEQQQQQQSHPITPATRQPLKIMMRDMKVATRDEHDQPPATEIFHHSNMGKPPYHQRPNDSSDHQHTSNIDKSLPQQQQRVSPWKAADRGPIATTRTLYEPEGDKSAKKFNALIKQTSSERGKRSSVSDSTQDGEQLHSPSGDIKILKAEEKQPKGKHQLTGAAVSPDDPANTTHYKSQQSSSSKNRTTETSTTTKKGSKKERPSFQQYQPPPAREQDEQAYPESKGRGRKSFRQDYNYEQQQGGDGRSQRRRDRQQSEGKHQSEGKYHSEGKHQSEKRHTSESKHQAEGKTHFESKQHSDGKRQHLDSSSRRDSRSRKERELSKEPSVSTHEQTEQLNVTTTAAADASKEDATKPEQDDKGGKQSGKDSHSKGGNSSGGEVKHKKKSGTSGATAAQRSDTKEKSRTRGRNRGGNNDDWYYSEDYYNQWYAAGGYDYYDYYHYDDYNAYYSDRRAPSGRQKQQQSYDGSSKSISERRDNGVKKGGQQQQSDRGGNRPARTRGGDRKEESLDDKTQQHRTTKDKSREVGSEELPRSKPAEEADGSRERSRRKDNKQQQEINVDKKRSNRTSSSKGSSTQQSSTASTSKSSASHDPVGRGQSRTSSSKTTSGLQDRPQQSEDRQHTTASDSSSSKKEPAIKDKAASAKMANVDINSPTVFVIDEEQTVPLSANAVENDDFIRVTSKKEKREMKELEKHRQQEKQRKAEEEENKKKQHSLRKSSQKSKHQQQQQHQLQDHSLAHEDHSLSTNWSTTTTNTASIWTESFTNLLSEGVNQTSTYMAAAHSPLVSPGDYQLFPPPPPTTYSTSSVPLAHLSAAVDSSVAQPTSASQSHTLSETDTKPTGVGRQDASSAGHGAIRTDLPMSKSHSSASVGGAIGRGRGSSSSRAPGSNRGSSSSRDSSKKIPLSSSDTKVSSTTSPKISKPSSAVRSKPSTTTTNSLSSDKVTRSSATTATTMAAATARKKMSGDASVRRPTQDVGGSKRAGGHSVAGTHDKSNKQRSSKPLSTLKQQQPTDHEQPRPVSTTSISSSNVNTVSYANAVKSSPSLQNKKTANNKPVAYVKPTASNPTPPSLSLPEQDDDTTIMSTSVEALPIIPSFPTAHLSQEELMAEDHVIASATADEQVKVTNSVVPVSFVSPVVTKSPSPAAVPAAPVTMSTRLPSFAPFTFVASPSTTSSAQVTTATTSTVTNHSAEQSTNVENRKEGITEVEEVASKRIRLAPIPVVQRTDHSTKLNIAAVPFIPSSLPTATDQKLTIISTVAAASASATPTMVATPNMITPVVATPTVAATPNMTTPTVAATPNVTTPTVAATPNMTTTVAAKPNMTTPTVAATPNMTTPTVAAMPHKASVPTACYPLPTATVMPTPPNIMSVIMPHPQMGSGYAIPQQTPYPSIFPTAVPSHAYQMATHPHSIVGLPYAAGYPIQQPTMLPSAVNNNSMPAGVAPNYNFFVPPITGASNVLPPQAVASVHHARMEQRKKEQQLKALNDTKRFFEQNATLSVVKHQTHYKFPPTVPGKQQIPITEGGRRTLLENPPVAMGSAMLRPPVASMVNPLELTNNNNNPSTGSKRKRRPPLMPLPQLPTADVTMATNNVTIPPVWDNSTNNNTLYQ